MRKGGLEPPRVLPHRILNPARLPIPPLSREAAVVHIRPSFRVSMPEGTSPRGNRALPGMGVVPPSSPSARSGAKGVGSVDSCTAPDEGRPAGRPDGACGWVSVSTRVGDVPPTLGRAKDFSPTEEAPNGMRGSGNVFDGMRPRGAGVNGQGLRPGAPPGTDAQRGVAGLPQPGRGAERRVSGPRRAPSRRELWAGEKDLEPAVPELALS